MKLTTRDHLIEVSALNVTPEMDIETLIKPVSVLRIPVMDSFVTGIEKLAIVLEEPFLKMTNSAKNWTIYQKDSYAIAEQSGAGIFTTPWKLDSLESVEFLKKRLSEGKWLVQQQSNGFRILAKGSDVDNLVVERDYNELWLEACRSYLEIEMLSQVRWSFTSRRGSRIDTIVKDIALTFGQEGAVGSTVTAIANVDDVVSASTYFTDQMQQLLNASVTMVSEFVQHDPWAYYSIVIDGMGLSLNRHRDARALVWNKRMIDEIRDMENEQEVLSAWAMR